MKEKGQVSSYDILAALFLFVLTFATMRGIWLDNLQSAEAGHSYLDMRIKAAQAADSLLKIRGFPSNWNSDNVELVGLAEKESVLSERKLQEFAAMDYDAAKEMLWLGNYDFRLELYAKNQSDDLNIGMPIDNNSTVVSLRRSVKYKGAEGSVVFEVFKE